MYTFAFFKTLGELCAAWRSEIANHSRIHKYRIPSPKPTLGRQLSFGQKLSKKLSGRTPKVLADAASQTTINLFRNRYRYWFRCWFLCRLSFNDTTKNSLSFEPEIKSSTFVGHASQTPPSKYISESVKHSDLISPTTKCQVWPLSEKKRRVTWRRTYADMSYVMKRCSRLPEQSDRAISSASSSGCNPNTVFKSLGSTTYYFVCSEFCSTHQWRVLLLLINPAQQGWPWRCTV